MNFNDPFAHGAYLTWGGDVAIGSGVLKFDIVEEQDVTREADIVEHPVETGAQFADHYRVKLRTVKLTAFLSQEPTDPSLYPQAGGELRNVELVLPAYPQNAALLLAKGVTNPDGLVIQSLTKQPPTHFTDRVLTYANPVDTLNYLEGVIDDLMANATPIDVATASNYYPQHLIASVGVKRNFATGTGAAIEITLRQVIFVSTDTVAAPPTPKKPKDKPKTDKGKQNPTPAPLQSAAAKITDAVTGGSTPQFFTSGGLLNLPVGAL